MTRLPYLREDQLDESGRVLWNRLLESRGAGIVNEEGGLVGPYNVWLHAPEVGRRIAELGTTALFQTSLDRGLSEIAIITTGAAWKAEFEWWAHSRMALDHGVTEAVVEAIGRGLQPPFEREDERLAHAVATQLARGGTVDAATYDRGVTTLGHRGMVELVALCSYYTGVCFLLNTFDVPLPEGAKPQWRSQA